MDRADLKNLIHRYCLGTLSEAELMRIDLWRKLSPKNEQLIREYEEVWRLARPLETEPLPAKRATWESLERRLDETGDPSLARLLPLGGESRNTERVSWSRWLAAALVFLTLGTGLYRIFVENFTTRTVRTEYAKQSQIQLPDGSTVKLNSDSELRFVRTLDESARVVELRGEAYFQVVADQRPFVVKTANAEVRVLGTKFNVLSRDQHTRVFVKSGRVKLNSLSDQKAKGVEVVANQMSACRATNPPEEPVEADSDRFLGWLEGTLLFDRTPLGEIVVELRRYYGVEIVLADARLQDESITGSFNNRSLETVLTSICTTLNLKYAFENSRYVIRRK